MKKNNVIPSLPLARGEKLPIASNGINRRLFIKSASGATVGAIVLSNVRAKADPQNITLPWPCSHENPLLDILHGSISYTDDNIPGGIMINASNDADLAAGAGFSTWHEHALNHAVLHALTAASASPTTPLDLSTLLSPYASDFGSQIASSLSTPIGNRLNQAFAGKPLYKGLSEVALGLGAGALISGYTQLTGSDASVSVNLSQVLGSDFLSYNISCPNGGLLTIRGDVKVKLRWVSGGGIEPSIVDWGPHLTVSYSF